MKVVPKVPDLTKNLGKISLFPNIVSFKLNTLCPALFNSIVRENVYSEHHKASQNSHQQQTRHFSLLANHRAISSNMERENNANS